eukprot:10012860-Ditylum_brightwellii.AAC.1
MEESRFHFDQLCRGGKKSLFERHQNDVVNKGDSNENEQKEGGDDNNEKKEEIVNENYTQDIKWVQSQLYSSSSNEEDVWLEEVRDVIAPRIRKQLAAVSNLHQKQQQQEQNLDQLLLQKQQTPFPDCYNATLALLRNIVETNRWPDTSVARSKVIRSLPSSSSSTTTEASKASSPSSGSFTVVNPKRQVSSYNLPLANALFPELVKAVFELEETLSKEHTLKQTDGKTLLEHSKEEEQRRPPSSHCAINCNAQFTPHVDSGRGSGQSLSMIVGLGDYIGGELAVEGSMYDIRYEPLEFDGWKLRHWTNMYQGERFSLVWFTPAEFSVDAATTQEG